MDDLSMDSATPSRSSVRDVWDANASFWDEKMGEGNLFHSTLIAPSAERLLDLQAGESVIEFGCGNGQFSRRMAELGANVTATELSPQLVELARKRTEARPEIAGRITYAQLDASDSEQLAAIAGGPFDAAACNMVIMDMIEVDPLFQAIPQLLKPGGRFVFTIMHPVLNNSGGTSFCLEERDIDGDIHAEHSMKIYRYRTTGATRGLAMLGQPEKQWYFHRTLSVLFGAAFAAGLVMDGIEEPYLASDPTVSERSLDWRNFQEIPPVLAVRLRVPLR
jgi:2-polyprenyl-3-methyl-5-hydroxy-6-metoxy-1,4-benzoquinol methylase